MDILFENRYYTTRKMMTEFGRKYAVGPRKPLMIVCWAVFAVALIPALVAPEVFDADYWRNILLMGAVMLAVSFMPQFYAWSVMKNTKKQNDGAAPEVVITFGETIKLHEGMVDVTIEYRKIQKVVRLKHSYMLMIGKQNGVMLKPDSFTKGTFAEFKEFLREKRPDLTVPE